MNLRMNRKLAITALLLAALAAPASAQLGGALPADPLGTVGRVGDAVRDVTGAALDPVADVARDAGTLASERLRRLSAFVSGNRARVEWDDAHQPAVRGEMLLLDPDAAALKTVQGMGFTLIEQGAIEGLDVPYARLRVPERQPLAAALKTLRKALPGREISADPLHFPAGRTQASTASMRAKAAAPALPRGGRVGVIDGAIAGSRLLASQRGFASGAPKASAHASAIASLLAGAGTAQVYGADVYGDDPAGGNALAIARALGWMQGQGVPVVSISLVGPANPLLARAVAAAQGKGMVVVAAVGNDGAAAPPAYPASYPGVIAVTGVDGAGRVLIEAGRATHLDYAAPGADMSALVLGKGRVSLRGTSYAAPLAASRIAARRAILGSTALALRATDAEALRGSRRAGRGVLCNICRSGL